MQFCLRPYAVLVLIVVPGLSRQQAIPDEIARASVQSFCAALSIGLQHPITVSRVTSPATGKVRILAISGRKSFLIDDRNVSVR